MEDEIEKDEGVAKARRRLLLKTVGIPESSAECVIIPPNEDLNGFARNWYNEEFWDKYISKNDFIEIVDNASKLASFAYSQKRDNDNKQLSSRLKMIFYSLRSFYYFILIDVVLCSYWRF